MSCGNLDPPLADYFWIAGIDSVSYGEHLASENKAPRKSFTEQLLVAIETDEEGLGISPSLLVPTATNGGGGGGGGGGSSRPSNGSSNGSASPTGRLSRTPSGETVSAASTSTSTSRSSTPALPGLMRNSSNSSNSTITEATTPSLNLTPNGQAKRDFDFDKALLKFAAERDSFLEDLSFSAGTVVPNRPLMHPRAQQVFNSAEPAKLEKTNSLRRRISLRDLTSMRRSPSVVNRACKFLHMFHAKCLGLVVVVVVIVVVGWLVMFQSL
jgi:hypothetical protein